jgi:DNA-binding transcriptional MerR regulator
MDSAEAPEAVDISELADLAGVTPRTVRFYIQQGLLPSPGQTGPGTRYGLGYVSRLRLIRRLQREHLPLAEIRKRLAGLDEAAVEAVLESAEATPSSAVDYVRTVLGSAVPAPPSAAGSPPPLSAMPSPRKPTSDRSQWERIALTDDVELHVRRPLSRDTNRRLERLLEQARRIFEEEP